ncbi:extracellular solute-binding protein family 1 [Spirochaeta thermophila DSM 6578]|uniref:Extracellular solute-binding protein family 1 n=1 Tax=Winmispira thermophila (strain ATCC 700085 / DSM 6578 / Z-1203) TaxID=869211 RepID=G0GEJ2_WINT7|nr:extracellular solute-binding protein [Spirochaeta thermophila]AEJ60680.1 extracellular solute-binding protein family 1 [Spirochaeta thermophila DSM 6578]
MRKLVCAALSLLVAATVWAGPQAEQQAGAAQIKEIDIVLDRILMPEDGLDQWIAEYEKLFGIKLNVTKPPHNQYSQILGTMFAANDLPDICEIQTADYVPYAKSGKLVPLEDFIKASPVVKSIDSQYYEAYRLKDGHIYGFPTYKGGGCVGYIRKDWLDTLGLKVPTTWDEFVTVLKAFTFNDPDGDGQNDTVGMTLPFQVPVNEFDYYNRFIMQGAYFDFQKKNGKWVDGFTQPEMKAALQRFQQLYSEGLLDREFFTNKTSTARTKIYEGQAGFMEYWAGTWGTRMDASAKASNPNAEVVSIPPIEGAHYVSRVGPVFGITTAAKNPKAVFDAIIGTMWDKGKGQMLWTFGVEGLHYKTVGENKIEMLPQPSNPSTPMQKSFIDPHLTLNDWALPIEFEEKMKLSVDIHNTYAVQLGIPEGGDLFSKYVGEIRTLKQEIFSKIVTGEYSVDEGLKMYQQKAKELHIDEVLAELNG